MGHFHADRRRRLPHLSGLARGLVAGVSGTAAMAGWYHLVRRVRRDRYNGVEALVDGTAVEGLWSPIGLDYDDTLVPGQIVAKLLHLPEPTRLQAQVLALTLRWTYGSAFGFLHVLLRNRIREPYATAAFGAVLMAVASAAFPLLGRTPPPWRWPLDAQLTSVSSHAVYIGIASAAENMLR